MLREPGRPENDRGAWSDVRPGFPSPLGRLEVAGGSWRVWLVWAVVGSGSGVWALVVCVGFERNPKDPEMGCAKSV